MDADSTFSVGLDLRPFRVRQDLVGESRPAAVLICQRGRGLLRGERRRHRSPPPPRTQEEMPRIAARARLKEAMSALRQGKGIPSGKKVLLVIDQFEQWLHANREAQNPELVRALRQCDGGRVQCIAMVRDDFWLASTRFMQQLEIRLVEGQNSALVDLFDMEHARRVLTKFGCAYGRFPQVDEEMERKGGAETGRRGDREKRRRARAETQRKETSWNRRSRSWPRKARSFVYAWRFLPR